MELVGHEHSTINSKDFLEALAGKEIKSKKAIMGKTIILILISNYWSN